MAPTRHKTVEGETKKLSNNDVLFQVRSRFTIAQVNAGVELLPALRRGKYRMVSMGFIAVGGAVGAVTAVLLRGTQGGSVVSLLSAAQANLTQSTLVGAGPASVATGATILADGASFAVCDINKKIDVIKSGSDITTATHIDVFATYVIEGDDSPL